MKAKWLRSLAIITVIGLFSLLGTSCTTTKSIKIGDRVDVWASSVNDPQPFAPEPVVFGAIVLAIENNSSMAQITTSVELRR